MIEGVGVFEEDPYDGELEMVWSMPLHYPHQGMLAQCALCALQELQEAKEEAFVFAVCGKRHFYIRAFEGGRKVTAGEQQQHVEGEEDSEERNLAPAWKTRHPNFAIVIETEEYFVDKYRALLDVAAEEFASSDRDMTLLSGVYFVNYQGSWKMDGRLIFSPEEYNQAESLLPKREILCPLIEKAGVSAICKLWAGVLLKKRVAITGSSRSAVADATRVLACLAWYRKDFSMIRPFVGLDMPELMADLRDTPHWIAGFVGSHSSVRDRDDLYDLLLDLDSTSVSVALHAQDVFSSDSVYRKAIGAELESSKGEGDPLVLKSIADKVKELLRELQAVHQTVSQEQGDDALITLRDIKARGHADGAADFLFRLAQAEKLA